VLKRIYFVAVMDGVFCLDAQLIYKRAMLSVIMLEWSTRLWAFIALQTL